MDWCFTAMEGQGGLEQMDAVLSPGERETGSSGQQMRQRYSDSWINPGVTGLPFQSHSVIGRSRGSNTKGGKVARDKSNKFKVAPESMSSNTGLGRPGRQREIRKETSEC